MNAIVDIMCTKQKGLELSLLKWQQCQWPKANTMTTIETISWSKKNFFCLKFLGRNQRIVTT